jgi:hypothetical protein
MSQSNRLLAVALVAACVALPRAAAAHVQGTSSGDVVVYGTMYYYAIPDGGGWAARYWGEGGCVFEIGSSRESVQCLRQG